MVKRFGEVSELRARKYLPEEVLKNLEEIYKSLL
jgi:hypothetical protein